MRQTCGPVWRFTHITAHRPPVADAGALPDRAGIAAGTGRQPRTATSVTPARCPRSRSTMRDRWALPFPSPAAPDS